MSNFSLKEFSRKPIPLWVSGPVIGAAILYGAFLVGDMHDLQEAVLTIRTELGWPARPGDVPTQRLILAAEDGNRAAQARLGMIYMRGGGGLPQDVSKAIDLWTRAAAAGDARSQQMLGRTYAEGAKGIEKNPTLALQFTNLAADQGMSRAQVDLARWTVHGEMGLSRDVTEGLRLYKLAADKGNVRALVDLGVLYQDGALVAPDLAAAADYYSKAIAQRNHPIALNNLGQMHERGLGGLAVNKAEAIRLYKLAAAMGNADAQAALGKIAP